MVCGLWFVVCDWRYTFDGSMVERGMDIAEIAEAKCSVEDLGCEVWGPRLSLVRGNLGSEFGIWSLRFGI